MSMNPAKRLWIIKTLVILAIAGILLISVAAFGFLWHFSKDLPKIISIADYKPALVTRVLGSGGKEDVVMGEFMNNERRYLVPYERIPDLVVKAFISAEDDKFFEHQGVNFAAMIRAGIANFKAGHVVQGGSTITQQVTKSLLLTSERSFDRKIKEVLLAYKLEKNLSKHQILYLYLNQIYFGHHAYGVQAAARTYFRKDVSALTVAEAAILAGMPQAPGKYSPQQNPKKAKDRQLYVLKRMMENKFISQAQMSEAAAQPLKVYGDEDLNSRNGAYLMETIRKSLIEKYGEKMVYEGGLTVSIPTTPELTLAARNSLREGLRMIDKRSGYRGPIQHLKDVNQTEEVLKEQRLKMIKDKLGFEVFTADGRMDAIEALHLGNIQSEVQLLDPGELYQAVVTSIDDKRKTVGVMLGAIKGEIPMDKMRWARTSDFIPSKLLSKGDMIWVKLAKGADDQLTFALEQEPAVQGALFSIDVQSGAVLAMEGGYDFDQSEFNRAIQAMRQPGSSFKPIIFAAGLEKGFTPASVIMDSPIVYRDTMGSSWKPSNFEEKFYGDTTFRQALIKSRNVPTIKIVESIQVPFLIDYAKRLGMNSQFPNDLSISLGSMSISLVELTKTYAIFPRQGRKVNPIFISSIKDHDGKVLEEQKSNLVNTSASPTPGSVAESKDSNQVMDPRVAYVMTHLMNEVVAYGTGHEAKSLGRPAAGKTGTTNDYLDAWFMGFTPNIVTGVWVGYDSQKSIGHGETGARAALPIWLSYMKEAVKTSPEVDFAIPSGITFASIDPNTGKLVSPNSPSAIKEAFVEGTEPNDKPGPNGTAAQSQSQFFKDDID